MEFSFFKPWGEIVNGMNKALKYSEADSLRLGRWRENKVSVLEKFGKMLAMDVSGIIERGSFDLVRTHEIGLLHWGAKRTVGRINVNIGYYSPRYDEGFYEKVDIVIRDSLDFGDTKGKVLYPFKIEMEKRDIRDELIRKNEFYGGEKGASFLGKLFEDGCFVKERFSQS
jgi:hypothetical protein